MFRNNKKTYFTDIKTSNYDSSYIKMVGNQFYIELDLNYS